MRDYVVIPKIRKETQKIKMVFELKKDLQENEVVCSHCRGTGLEVVDHIYGIQGDTTYIGTRFPYKIQSLSSCRFCHNGVQKKCPNCGNSHGNSDKECPCGIDIKNYIDKKKK